MGPDVEGQWPGQGPNCAHWLSRPRPRVDTVDGAHNDSSNKTIGAAIHILPILAVAESWRQGSLPSRRCYWGEQAAICCPGPRTGFILGLSWGRGSPSLESVLRIGERSCKLVPMRETSPGRVELHTEILGDHGSPLAHLSNENNRKVGWFI